MTTLSGEYSSGPAGGPRRRATMRDVAALAGVSLKSVSRVVNREAGVSAELAARVSQAADQLDYRPDFTASNLRRSDRRTASIGLLVEDVANEFSAAVHAGVEEAARARQVAVLTASIANDPDRERSVVRAFSSRRVDGLVVVPSGEGQSDVWNARDVGVPLVFVDRAPRGLVADCVLTNNREGTRAGVEHLIGVGHDRIAFLGGIARLETAQERYEGFVDAMSGAGLAVRPDWVRRDLGDADAATAATRALFATDDRPTAIFAAQNQLAMGTFRALREMEMNHRVALVGFDDFALADLLDPAVTVVAQDPRDIGFHAAQMLFAKMDDNPQGAGSGAKNDDATVHVVPSRLIIRQSSTVSPVN